MFHILFFQGRFLKRKENRRVTFAFWNVTFIGNSMPAITGKRTSYYGSRWQKTKSLFKQRGSVIKRRWQYQFFLPSSEIQYHSFQAKCWSVCILNFKNQNSNKTKNQLKGYGKESKDKVRWSSKNSCHLSHIILLVIRTNNINVYQCPSPMLEYKFHEFGDKIYLVKYCIYVCV